ncbi:hypothetical protein GCM10028807_09800 [Spirosoma daeguense]
MAGAASITYVPIRPHIIRRNDGTGGYTMASLNNVLALTNKYYLYNGSGIQFYFAGTTPDYIDNTTLYNQYRKDTDDATIAPHDVNNALNQYYVHEFDIPGLGGYAEFPENTVASTRTIIKVTTDEDRGNRLVPHELGHTFNLIHTQETYYGAELVTRGAGANCSTAGDMVCDTPADPYGQFPEASFTCVSGCPSTYTCSFVDSQGNTYQPSPTNIMSYYFPCTHDFTPGQYERIQAGLALRQTHTAYTLDAPATSMAAPSNVAAAMVTGAIVISWQDNSSNEMGYFIERSTSPTTGFLPVGGVGPNTTTFTDRSFSPNTQYYYRVKGSNTTDGSISSTATVATTNCLPYMQDDGCPYDINITGVTVNGTYLSQESGCSPASSGHYTSFTGVSGTVLAGQSATITVNKSTANSMGGAIWVDLNNSGSFETNELVYSMPESNTASTFSGSITIPLSTTATKVAMRVIGLYYIVPNDPCGTYAYGETEDYTLTVIQPCSTSVVYVTQNGTGLQNGTSWTNAFSGTALQTAINSAAGCGAQIWVASGTYKPTTGSDRAISFSMVNGVSIYGGFAGGELTLSARVLTTPSSTTLSGDIDNDGILTNNSYNVIRNNNLNNTARLDGFVITGGNAISSYPNDCGGGIFNESSSPTLTNCSFLSNYATRLGGAIYNLTNSNTNLTNCSFLNNTGLTDGGAIFNDSSSPTLNNCSFLNNTTTNGAGGAILNVNRNVSITNCRFQGNNARIGGAIYNNNSSINLVNCSFLSNSATQYGGAIINNTNSNSRITNCTFLSNTAFNGGAFYNRESSNPTLTNCSFLSNTAVNGGVIYNEVSGSSDLVNCVVFGNGANNTFVNIDNSTISARNSLFDTNTSYTSHPSNLTSTAFPFVSATDLRLNACALAINKGTNSASGLSGITTDLAGNGRFYQSGIIDMGGYEFQGVPNVQTGFTAQPVAGSAVCVGGIVTASVSVSGTGSFTYQWYKDGSVVNGQTSATLSLTNVQTSEAGSYSAVVTGFCNSVTSTAFSLTVNTIPAATLLPSSATLTCANPSVTLTASGGTSYTFTNSSGTVIGTPGVSNTLVVSSGETYSVIVANATGCKTVASTTVSSSTNAPALSINPSNATLTCTNQTVSLTAVGVGTYRWNTGATSQIISTTSAATYSVTLTGENGCSTSASVVVSGDQTAPAVSINPAIGTPTGTTLTCATPVVSLSAGGSGTYRWSTGATTSTISATSASIYSVTLTGANGCTATTSIQVFQDNTPPTISINPSIGTPTGATLTCATPQVSLTALGSGALRWSTGATTSSISVSVAGVYSVTLTSANGCSATSSISVTYQNCAPTVANALSSQTATVGQTFSYTIPATTFIDVETPNSLTISVVGLPMGLSFVSPNVITGTLSTTVGTPFSVTVLATDPGDLSVTTGFNLTVLPRNFAITGVTMLDCNLTGYYERRINFMVSYDATNGQPISVSVVNELTATTVNGPYQLTVYTDNPDIVFRARQQGTSNEATFAYNWLSFCSNGNPRVENPIPPQSATIGQAFSYTIPANTFTDAETPNSLSLSVVGLPAGLSLVVPATITGMASALASAFYSVTVIATDLAGGTVATILPLSVVNPGGCESMFTLKAGDWNDASVWSCGRIPLITDTVTLNHGVSLPPIYQAQALRVIYTTTGRLLFGTDSRLRLGGN